MPLFAADLRSLASIRVFFYYSSALPRLYIDKPCLLNKPYNTQGLYT